MAVVLDLLNKDARPRHPEKAHRPDQPVLRKPDWIRVKAPVSRGLCRDAARSCARTASSRCARRPAARTSASAGSKKHATFMIMGDTCTRACAFCNVKTGMPRRARSARAGACRRGGRRSSGSTHIVVTSVDRDDLADGGAEHFAQVIRAHPRATPDDDDRDADARLPAQGRRGRDGGRGAARRLQPQSRDGAVALSRRSGPARATSTRCGCCSGSRSSIRRSSPSPASWSASARSGTRCCR